MPEFIYAIGYDLRQGVLMRILNEVARRGLEYEYVTATPVGVMLNLEVTPKQDGQLQRAWKGIVDVKTVQVKNSFR